MNIHSLFNDKNVVEFASGDTKDIIEDLKDIQTQFNENMIKINEEFAKLSTFTDQTKAIVQSIENDLIKHGKKLRKLKQTSQAQETAFAVMSQDVIEVTDLAVNLRVDLITALQDSEMSEKTLINKLNIN